MTKPYRSCVVAVVTRDYQSFLVGERAHIPDAWQFPQGGIEEDETPQKALVRELFEETGIKGASILRESDHWVSYDFPKSLSHPITQKYRGQRQKWFLLKLDDVIQPDLSKSDGELSQIDWRTLKQVLNCIIDWKKDCYHQGLRSLGLEV